MPAFSTVELLKITVVAIVLVSIALYYLPVFTKLGISRRLSSKVMTSCRLLGLYGGLLYYFCLYLQMPVNLFLILLICWLVISISGCYGADDLLGFAIGIVLALPLLLGVGFVYWIPVFEMFVLHPPEPVTKSDNTVSEHELINETGVIIATLKPSGTVEINGKAYPASSEDGTFLDVGETVKVCGSRNTSLLVRPFKDDGTTHQS